MNKLTVNELLDLETRLIKLMDEDNIKSDPVALALVKEDLMKVELELMGRARNTH